MKNTFTNNTYSNCGSEATADYASLIKKYKKNMAECNENNINVIKKRHIEYNRNKQESNTKGSENFSAQKRSDSLNKIKNCNKLLREKLEESDEFLVEKLDKVLSNANQVVENEITDSTPNLIKLSQHHSNNHNGKRNFKLPLENLRLFQSSNPTLQSPKTTSRFKDIHTESHTKRRPVSEFVKDYETFGETEDLTDTYSYGNGFSETKNINISNSKASSYAFYKRNDFMA